MIKAPLVYSLFVVKKVTKMVLHHIIERFIRFGRGRAVEFISLPAMRGSV